MTSTHTGTAPLHKQRRRAVIASLAGAAMEWYDFTLYGLAAAIVFGPLFFPTANPVAGTLSSLATFGVGFLARPVGGIVFGHLGDRLGRRKVLVITLVLMSVSSFCIGLLPTYSQAGVVGAVLLVVLRIAQGLGAGAEYAGAITLAAEYSNPRHRGLTAALPTAGTTVGSVCAALMFGLFSMLPEQQFHAWGWRVPFLLSVVLFVFGLWIRMRVNDSPVYEAVRNDATARRVGVLELVRRHPLPLLKAVVMSAGPNAAVYLPVTFGVSYLTSTLSLPPSHGTTAVAIGNLCAMVMLLVVGAASDRVGRRPMFITGTVLVAAMSFPFFVLLNTKSFGLIVLAFILLYSVSGHFMLGSQPSLLAEQFPTEVRYSGVATARELASALVGGTLPFVATALIAATGTTRSVSVLVIAVVAAAAVAAAFMRDRRGAEL